ncbi:MAG: ERCC4-type nuclease [Candidatus Bathyarchaeota archaeon]|nr:MAG: ERCC4-type nuclease [Candidatus Bathyarchaeota archaeon]
MKLLIDHRERQIAPLVEDVCSTISWTQLPIGDYVLIADSEAIVIERKTVTDFVSSVRSNRLWDQLLRMMKTVKIFNCPIKRRLLLIHGNIDTYLEQMESRLKNDGSVYWSQLMGACLEIICVYNTPIIHAESDPAFTAFLRTLVKRESTGMNDKLPRAKWYMKPVKANLPIKDRKKYILSALPHIGDRLSENLLTHFHTISNVACASIEELQNVPKIGKKKATLIYTMFHS